MRISVNENDTGCCGEAYVAEIFLDGKLLENCETADDELGEVVCFDMCSLKKGIKKRETLKGKVEIVLPEGLQLYTVGEFQEIKNRAASDSNELKGS
ncbi:hypothetical protein KAR91_26120 [Candidatus Pacearchaeota archaeon]|nr:hypothetical protein [Candidatus Pacearchaeota archaeon]